MMSETVSVTSSKRKMSSEENEEKQINEKYTYYNKPKTNFWFRFSTGDGAPPGKRRQKPDVIGWIDTLDGPPGPTIQVMQEYQVLDGNRIQISGALRDHIGTCVREGIIWTFTWPTDRQPARFNPELMMSPPPTPELIGVFEEVHFPSEATKLKWGLDDVKRVVAADPRALALVTDLVQVLKENGPHFIDNHSPYKVEFRPLDNGVVICWREEQDLITGEWKPMPRENDPRTVLHDTFWVSHGHTGCKNPLYVKLHEDLTGKVMSALELKEPTLQVHLSRMSTGQSIMGRLHYKMHEDGYLLQLIHPQNYSSEDAAFQREVNIPITTHEFLELVK